MKTAVVTKSNAQGLLAQLVRSETRLAVFAKTAGSSVKTVLSHLTAKCVQRMSVILFQHVVTLFTSVTSIVDVVAFAQMLVHVAQMKL